MDAGMDPSCLEFLSLIEVDTPAFIFNIQFYFNLELNCHSITRSMLNNRKRREEKINSHDLFIFQ